MPKTGFSVASFSRVVSGRRFESLAQPAVWREEVIEEPGIIGGGKVAVAVEGQFILRLARNVPLGGGEGLVLAHGQAGPGLPRVRRVGGQVLGPQAAQYLQPLGQGLGAVEVQQHLPQALADGDRGIGGRVDTAGNGRIDLAQLDLVGQAQDRFQAGGARLLEVVGGGFRGERRAQHRLAGEVEVAGVLEDCARGNLADPLVLQAEAGNQAVQCGGQHVLVGRLGVGPAGPGERNPVAAHHHGPAH